MGWGVGRRVFKPKRSLSLIFCNRIPLNLLTGVSDICVLGQELPGSARGEIWREGRKEGQWVGFWPNDEVYESELAGTKHQH